MWIDCDVTIAYLNTVIIYHLYEYKEQFEELCRKNY